MNENQKPVIVTNVITSIILAIILIGGLAVVGNKVGNKLDVMAENIKGLDIDEQAIANAIVAGITIPEWTVPEMPDTKKVDDLWQMLFVTRINELKGYVYTELTEDERELTQVFKNNVNNEFDADDWTEVTEYVEDTLEDFDNFEPIDFKFELDKYDTEEVGFEIVQTGEVEAFNGITYNEGEDSEVVVTLEYNFEYEKDDSDKVYKDTLYVTIEAEYDGSVLEDLDVTYSL